MVWRECYCCTVFILVLLFLPWLVVAGLREDMEGYENLLTLCYPWLFLALESHLAIVRIYIVKPRFEAFLAIVSYAMNNDDMLNK